jgi:hypothetical protein
VTVKALVINASPRMVLVLGIGPFAVTDPAPAFKPDWIAAGFVGVGKEGAAP